MTENLNVHIVEDDPAIRYCVGELLESEGLRVKTYASALDFVAAIGLEENGCVITDLSMPGMSGIALLTYIEQRRLPMSVVIITGHDDVSLAVQAMKKGAVDFIQKPFRCDELIQAVRTALAHRSSQRDGASSSHEVSTRLATLSVREQEVLTRILAGQLNKIIAYELGISCRTVEAHRANLMRKMQAASVSQLVSMSLLAAKKRA